MKKITIAALFLVFITGLTSQEEVPSIYQEQMAAALVQLDACETVEDYKAVSNQFVTISIEEKEEWLPLYYATYSNVLLSFMEEGIEKRDSILDQALSWIEKMEAMVPQESEVYALKALFYNARLSVDARMRGREYMSRSNAEGMKALNIDKDNPRALYVILKNRVEFALVFDVDISEECRMAKQLLEDWGKYEVRSDLHPTWAKNKVTEIAGLCDK